MEEIFTNSSLSTRKLTVDTVSPNITITYPLNTTYTTSITTLNFTLDETNQDTCWYAVNDSVNVTTSCSSNVTGLSSNAGTNTWTIWANDTAGHVDFDSVTFFVDTIDPNVTIVYPVNGTYYDSAQTQMNYTLSETNPEFCWYSTDGGSTNSTAVTAGQNFTLSSAEGQNNWTVYCNDTLGREGSDSVIFFVDTILPTIIINVPLNTTYSGIEELTFNVTSDEFLTSCNYSLNGATNISMDTSDNFTFTKSNSIFIEGQNNVSFYCYDLVGNLGYNITYFTINNLIVTLNSPADNYTTLVPEVTFNATTNLSGGTTLTNMSLWTNESGVWELKNFTNLVPQIPEYSSFNFGTVASDNPYVAWNGSSIFVLEGERVREYNTSGTATGFNFLTSGETTSAQGFTWNGTHFWVLDFTTDTAYSYDSSGTYTGTSFSTSEDSRMFDITWDGTYFWTVADTDVVYRYYSNGTYSDYSFSTSSKTTTAHGIAFNVDKLWIVDQVVSGNTYEYYTNGTYTGYNFTTGSQSSNMASIAYNGDGFYTSDFTSDNIWRYDFDFLNSKTQTWNRTITEDIIWNVQLCDSNGDCEFAAENRTLLLDSSIPQISVEAPVGNLDYGAIGGGELLNVTFTDTNIDSCWYNYNGTNVTIDGCLTGTKNSTTFILEEDNYNLTVYANDSFGNVNSSFTEWEYNLTEISQTYPISSTESSSETYTTNVSYNSTKYGIITGTLNINGSTYAGTNTGSGDNAVMSTSATMPSIVEETNFTAYWTIYLTDDTNTIDYNLSSNNVTVYIINLSLCDGINNVPFWNFTIYNESNIVEINSTFEVTFSISNEDGGDDNSFSFEDLTETNSQFDFCLSPGTENYIADANIRLTKSGFTDTFYNFQEVTITNSTREDNLYILITESSTSFIIHVVYADSSNVIGAEVRVERYYQGTGEWLVTEIITTDDDGEGVGHLLSEDADYRFKVYQSGVSIHNSSSTKITCSVTPCTVILVIPGDVPSGTETVGNLTSTLVYGDTTNIFTYTYSDTSGDFSLARLYVILAAPSNASILIACNDTKGTSSGILTCDISGQSNGTYIASGYITRTASEFLDKKIYETLGTKIYNSMGNDGVLWAFFVFIGIIMLGATRPSLAIIFGAVGLIVLSLLEIINIGALSIVAVSSIAIILLMRVGRE